MIDHLKIVNFLAFDEIELRPLKRINLVAGRNGVGKPVLINTLGDGVQRILLIALSLANAKDGLLLIDEIETHLHHSVIKKLWDAIFRYALLWNIQVVATTHSEDAIRQLLYTADGNADYEAAAQFIRLQINRAGKTEALIYSIDQLEDMLELELEIR